MKDFRHVILWGHSLHTNTFSYVYEGMERALQRLGHKVFWLPRDRERVEQIPDWSIGALFIVEGTVEQGVPITPNSWYVLHNCNVGRYPVGRYLVLQTYTDDVLTRDTHAVNPWTHYETSTATLYQPWATDLLPDEIGALAPANGHYIPWVGTIGKGVFGNVEQLAGWRRACGEHGLGFVQRVNISREEHIPFVRRGMLAPTICGDWQVRQGYIPCRIFKNLSYGQWGITNSPRVQAIFGGKLTFNQNTHKLFYDAVVEHERQDRAELMRIVAAEHTYINRVKRILEFL